MLDYGRMSTLDHIHHHLRFFRRAFEVGERGVLLTLKKGEYGRSMGQIPYLYQVIRAGTDFSLWAGMT